MHLPHVLQVPHDAHATAGVRDTWIAPAGRSWDAIRTVRSTGLRALDRLPGRPGAVLVHPRHLWLYFLVPAGAATAWDLPHTTALSRNSHLVLPPPDRELPPGPYWLLSPRRVPLCTETDVLRTALRCVLDGDRV
ncbi:hypothetical protein [Streptomyces minutiscleroticus]|uniref:Uncharacterized protein n=1 Tax=Streptomyces minutiscleroticus TaxID=68238 RepID=A0A918NRN9_9ACTN|nr:hypothetical protein [Streptomyces minutiscleroticus]GGX90009.1 hypothetical protein GCM10010358_50020 [Streptomyces minutiscleroticus]